ncbi:MAG: response regulator [Casimicrobiaceae bacterium]|nr:response regulator [Casimicrobiaceae bacterium]
MSASTAGADKPVLDALRSSQHPAARRSKLRLRTLLTVPFVLLVLLPSLLIGGMSLYTGVRAADHLSRQLVTDISQRIERTAVYQLQESALLLAAAFPSPRRPELTIAAAQSDIEALADRIFTALTASRSASYLYFARSDGAFVGVDRSEPLADAPAVLRLQRDPERPRAVYALDARGQRLREVETETRIFRARERPWFQSALASGRLTWTPVHRSLPSDELVITASLPVRDGEGRLLGVAAADIVLAELSEFMRRLKVSDHGVAYIVDGAGRLVAQSVGQLEELQARGGQAAAEMPLARDSAVSLVSVSARWWDEQPPHKYFTNEPLVAALGVDRQTVDVAARRIAEVPGLDWHVIVAIPRSDFLAPVVRNATILFVTIAAALVATLGLGLWVLRRVTRDVGHLVRVTESTSVATESLPPPRLALEELAALEHAFHDLFARWREAWRESQARRAQLEQLNATLELHVAERTQSLVKTTEELRAEVERRQRYERELERSTEAAREAAELKARFVAYLSHEIRTPLQTLVSTAESLRERATGSSGDSAATRSESEAFEERLATIDAACRALMTIVDGVLLYARYEQGHLALPQEPVQLAQCLEDARRLAVAATPGRGVPVKLAIDPDVPAQIQSNAGAIRQILVNLISNALKFTREGQIDVRVMRVEQDKGAQVLFTVVDTGVGMPSVKGKDRVELFQSDARERVGAVGHGVGLYLSRQLAVALGGKLTIESAEGRGTRVTLSIPYVAVEAQALSPQTATALGPSTVARPRAVLVVDDHALNREIVATRLRAIGYEVDVAESAHSARQRVRERAFDAVLMDLNLPDASGFDTARRILQEAEREGRTPPAVIALTASALDADRAQAAAAGMHGFVTKPATTEAIHAAIERALGERSGSVARATVLPPTNEPAILDREVILAAARRHSDERVRTEAIRRLIRVALDSLPVDATRWRAALESANTRALRESAHRIAGAASMLGAERIRRAAEDFLAGRADAKEARLCERIEEALAELRRWELALGE